MPRGNKTNNWRKIIMENDIDKIEENETIQPTEKPYKPWLFKKGNEFGKMQKRGPSMKTWLKYKLSTMNEEERQEFISDMPKEFLMRMAEGNPETKVELEEVQTPYANLTDEQKLELARRNIEVLGIRKGESGSDVLDAGNSELSKDGGNSQGSGSVPEKSGTDKQEGDNPSSTKSPENDNNHDQLGDTKTADQPKS